MKKYNIDEVLADQNEFYYKLIDKIKFKIRSAAIGIIKEFDSAKQTVSVQLVIRETIVIDGKYESKKVPLLKDVPIFMPRAGNFILTMPIKNGDECIIVYSDVCYDSWFQSGGEENEQITLRRHDLSDAIAICGIWSQPNVIDSYSTDSVELKTLDGTTTLRIKEGEVTIISDKIKLGDESGLRKLIDTKLIELFNTHIHTHGTSGGGTANTSVPTALLSEANCATVNTEAL